MLVDDDKAQIVRNIFTWYLDGMSSFVISKKLDEEGAITPWNQRFVSMGKEEQVRKDSRWNPKTSVDIIRNQVYIGNTVHRQILHNLDTERKCRKNNKENWIIVPDTHEAIIDLETFKKAEKIADTRRRERLDAIDDNRRNAYKRTYIKIPCRCGCCGGGARIGSNILKNEGRVYYYSCSARARRKERCSNFRGIKCSLVEKSVFDVIRSHIRGCIDTKKNNRGAKFQAA